MSLLQLPELPAVPWARLLSGGGEGGGYAYQIDASGLDIRNRMMYRLLLPSGAAPSVKARLRLKSTLQANNPAFEGVAVRCRGFRLSGGVPSTIDTQVWDSDPASKGKRAWFAQQSGTFTDAVFVEPVPQDLGIDYITFELIVRAGGGQVTISNIECRNHYAVPYPMDILGEQTWTSGFSIDTVASGISGDGAVRRWLKYIKTTQTKIGKGQHVNVFFKGAVKGRAYESQGGANAQRLYSEVGLMLKLRRVTGEYDYFTLFMQGVSIDNKTVFADGSVTIDARFPYTQTEVVAFVEPTQASPGYDTIAVDIIAIRDIELNMIVADYISPTQ